MTNFQINFKIIKLKNLAHSVGLFFLDLIFPIECLGCGREGEWLCAECFKRLVFRNEHSCLECRRVSRQGEFCPKCKEEYFLDGVWIAGYYEDKLLASLISKLKYNFVVDLSPILGKFISIFLLNLINEQRINGGALKDGLGWSNLSAVIKSPQTILSFKNSLLIPVPLSNKRLRWRGFNQAQLLTAEISKNFFLEFAFDQLIKTKHSQAQAKLNAEQRKVNLTGCFAWHGEKLNGRNIILVDDVVTTGATLNECAKTLKSAGAGEVWGLVVARN